MTDFDLATVAAELNARAQTHPIGRLQKIRKSLKKLTRLPGHDIFRLSGVSKTVFPDYAFHYGGRSELQFNIGKDGSGGAMLRHGVAFSFETSQTLPRVDVLKPNVRLFNDYLEEYPEVFLKMRMWHFQDGKPSDVYAPSAILEERVTNGVFLFLGKRVPIEELDYETILNDFDSLLPLYRYVEGGGESAPTSSPTQAAFAFRPGCSTKAVASTTVHSPDPLDVVLRHNMMQERLYQQLISQHGAENVGTELPSGVGTSVDLVVRRPEAEGYWFYEIKTAHSPRGCIRQAIGQLLEYSFWPGTQEASRLIVVGESPLDDEGAEYLHHLRNRFGLPIYYERISP